MTDEEYKKITQEFEKAFFEYHEYVDQFFTSSVDGVITRRATKTVTKEDADKIHIMRGRVDQLQDEWLKASTRY